MWLGELSRKHKKPICLDTVPQTEWDKLRSIGIDAVWFMGVWEERSPAGVEISMCNEGLSYGFGPGP